MSDDLAARLAAKLGLDEDTANDYLTAMGLLEFDDVYENLAGIMGDEAAAKRLAADIKGVALPPEAEAVAASSEMPAKGTAGFYRKRDDLDEGTVRSAHFPATSRHRADGSCFTLTNC